MRAFDDFIRRSEAINKINDIAAEFLKDHTIQCDIAAGVAENIKNDVIKTLPAAAVVEVVVCRECLYWGGVHGINVIDVCKCPNGGLRGAADHKDFCSDGKRCTFAEKLDYEFRDEK